MMNREDVGAGLEAGEKPIDLAIQKWREIKAGIGEDKGGENCALCVTYDCDDCPLCKYWEDWQCDTEDSPYHIWQRDLDAGPMLEALEEVKEWMVEEGIY